MNAMYAVGTVVAYAVCACFITWNLWRVPYFFIGGIFLLSLVCFGIVVRKFKCERKGINHTSTKEVKGLLQNPQLFSLTGKKSATFFYVFVILFAFI